MTKKILINYANAHFRQSQQKNAESAKIIGNVDKVICYSETDIDTDFFTQNKHILSQQKGGGYWLWKPYIILKTLLSKDTSDGDIIIYCDSGVNIIRDLTDIFDLPKKYNQDIILFDYETAKSMTKRDTFIALGCDTPNAHNAPHFAGTYSVYKKSKTSIAFVQQWIDNSTEQTLIDTPSQMGNEYPEFWCHRHDESTLSLTAFQFGVQSTLQTYDVWCDYRNRYATTAKVLRKKQMGHIPNRYFMSTRKDNRTTLQRIQYHVSFYKEYKQRYQGIDLIKYILRVVLKHILTGRR